MKNYVTEVAGRNLSVEVNELAGFANASVLVKYGDTVVLTTIVASNELREGVDFFPLSVDYEERLYAVGKIPGSFMKREGRPSEKAILIARAIDRSMRPLFPQGLRSDVSVVATVLSVEQDNSPEFCAMIGAAVAAVVSDIPFSMPFAGVFVGYVDGKFLLNPNCTNRANSQLTLTVSGTTEKVVMIEAGACEIDEQTMFDAIVYGHTEIKRLCAFIQKICDDVGKPKFSIPPEAVDENLLNSVQEYAEGLLEKALENSDKSVRDKNVSAVYDDVIKHFSEQCPIEQSEAKFKQILYTMQKKIVRRWLFENGKRVDGRKLQEIRPLTAQVGLLPRAHGSGLFARGQTQVLTVATLAPLRETQMLDGIDNEEYKRYMHHYNFPSFSVGETRPSRGPGRREVGHGALAERSLEPVLPSEEVFPYAIRLVSEVLSSNGSTSQGSVCGSTLALMDAGVPIKAPVAGISVGLISKDDKFVTMLDIQGLEDFFGDMDFKIAGTKKGITSIQVDVKIDGLTYEIIQTALNQAREGRIYILDNVMLPTITQPRSNISQYAPSIIHMAIPTEKIRDVIGQGGKMIQRIIAETGAKIDIEDDGRTSIASVDKNNGYRAMEMIENIIKQPEIGTIYDGKVVKIMDFGAFVEFLPGKEGLVHVSKIADKRVEKVSDVLKEGDRVKVKLIEVDKHGRNNLSMKDAQ